MAGMGFSLEDMQSWDKNGRKRGIGEDITNMLNSVLTQAQANKAQQQADLLFRATMQEKGFSPQGQQPNFNSQGGQVIPNPQAGQTTGGRMGGIFKNILGNLAGQQNMQYDPNQDINRQSKLLDQYYKQSQIAKNVSNIGKTEYEMSPEARAVKSRESVGRQNAKDKRTEALFDTFETNAVKKQQVADAREAATKITGGLLGQVQRNLLGKFKPNDQQLQEWQKIKMVLTDATLMNTAKTKGAISDKEMALFMKAAADDDLGSIAAMQPVFDKILKGLEADERAKLKTYQRAYGEDPSTWEELQPFLNIKSQQQQVQQIPVQKADYKLRYGLE